ARAVWSERTADRRLGRRQVHVRHRVSRAAGRTRLPILRDRPGGRLQYARLRELRALRPAARYRTGSEAVARSARERRRQPARHYDRGPAAVLRAPVRRAARPAHALRPAALDHRGRVPPRAAGVAQSRGDITRARTRERVVDHGLSRSRGEARLGADRYRDRRRRSAARCTRPHHRRPRRTGARVETKPAAARRSAPLAARRARAARAPGNPGAAHRAPAPSPQIRQGRAAAGVEFLFSRTGREAQFARAKPLALPTVRGRRGRRNLALSSAPRRLFPLVPRGHQGREPRAGSRLHRAYAGQIRARNAEAVAPANRETLQRSGMKTTGDLRIDPRRKRTFDARSGARERPRRVHVKADHGNRRGGVYRPPLVRTTARRAERSVLRRQFLYG